MLKINQGIAIVCMVNNTALREIYDKNNIKNVTTISNQTSSCALQLQHKKSQDGSFIWDKRLKAI